MNAVRRVRSTADCSNGAVYARRGLIGTGAPHACPSEVNPYCFMGGDAGTAGTCGKCKTNADCALSGTHAGPTCDVATGACVDIDSDGDGLFDSVEALLGTDPKKRDTDGDGIDDKTEVTPVGGGASTKVDTDGDGTIDALDLDSDDDGVSDRNEFVRVDGQPLDTDGDGTPNFRDEDDDGDLIKTKDEIADANLAGLGDDVDNDGKKNWNDTDADGDGALDLVEGRNDDDKDGIPNFLDVASAPADRRRAGARWRQSWQSWQSQLFELDHREWRPRSRRRLQPDSVRPRRPSGGGAPLQLLARSGLSDHPARFQRCRRRDRDAPLARSKVNAAIGALGSATLSRTTSSGRSVASILVTSAARSFALAFVRRHDVTCVARPERLDDLPKAERRRRGRIVANVIDAGSVDLGQRDGRRRVDHGSDARDGCDGRVDAAADHEPDERRLCEWPPGDLLRGLAAHTRDAQREPRIEWNERELVRERDRREHDADPRRRGRRPPDRPRAVVV